MKLLPLFVFWGLWFLGFSTQTAFSPSSPMAALFRHVEDLTKRSKPC